MTQRINLESNIIIILSIRSLFLRGALQPSATSAPYMLSLLLPNHRIDRARNVILVKVEKPASRALVYPLVRLHTSGPMTVLPNEGHKTIPNPLLVFPVTGQLLRKEALFVKEPP